MKNLRHIFLATSLFAVISASAIIDNPMTQAVINVYNEQLKQNPKDYNTLFRRANEYYIHDELASALSDINSALQYIPGGDKDMRFQAYMLRAGIHNAMGNPATALEDLNSAISLDPDSYTAIYEKANTEYTLGNYGAARTDFTRLQRLNSRSTDALIGFALCAMKENNLSAANDYLQQAVDFDANNPEIYVRRSNVRRQMGDHTGAVDDLVMAMSLRPDNSQIIAMIVDYGDVNYPATIAALTNAIQIAPENGLFRYLRASIAESHFNYLSAIEDYEYIIDNNLYNYHGLNAALARCLYSLGRYQQALDEVEAALNAGTTPAYYVLRSKILRALDRPNDAIIAATIARKLSVENVPAIVEMAMNYIDKKDYERASELLGEASMMGDADPAILLLRAWLLNNYMNQPVAAKGFNEQVLSVENYGENNVESLRGFALLNLGRKAEAEQWMENILRSQPDPDGLINYYAACFYTLADNEEKALECVERSLRAGYSDDHNWMKNSDGPVNVASLRDDLRFLRLLQTYNSIFGK